MQPFQKINYELLRDIVVTELKVSKPEFVCSVFRHHNSKGPVCTCYCQLCIKELESIGVTTEEICGHKAKIIVLKNAIPDTMDPPLKREE